MESYLPFQWSSSVCISHAWVYRRAFTQLRYGRFLVYVTLKLQGCTVCWVSVQLHAFENKKWRHRSLFMGCNTASAGHKGSAECTKLIFCWMTAGHTTGCTFSADEGWYGTSCDCSIPRCSVCRWCGEPTLPGLAHLQTTANGFLHNVWSAVNVHALLCSLHINRTSAFYRNWTDLMSVMWTY